MARQSRSCHDRLYNRRRLHSSLGHRTPVQAERENSAKDTGPFSSNLAIQAIDPDHQQNASRAQSQLRCAVTIRDQIIRTEWPWQRIRAAPKQATKLRIIIEDAGMFSPLCGWTSHVDKFVLENAPDNRLMPTYDENWFLCNGISDAPLNAGGRIFKTAFQSGLQDKTALISGNINVTYYELNCYSSVLSDKLKKEFQILPGNRILLYATNGLPLAIAMIAVLRIGAVAVLVPPYVASNELARYAELTKPTLFLYEGACNRSLVPGMPSRIYFLSLEEMIDLNSMKLSMKANSGVSSKSCVRTAPTDPAVILFTSGSTGIPKAVIHFHRDLCVPSETFSKKVVPIEPRDVISGTPSIANAYGLSSLFLAPLMRAATVVLESNTHPLNVFGLVAEHNVSQVYTTPSGFQATLEVLNDLDLSSLKTCLSAGENLSANISERWQDVTGQPIVNGVGTSETLAFFLGSPRSVAPLGSAGRAVPGYQTKLVASFSDSRNSKSSNALAVWGPTGCKYLSNVEAQASRIVDGWTLTGDLFQIDEEGFYWHYGRQDDIIVTNGINVSNIEIENVFQSHPFVMDCCAVGQPDQERGTDIIVLYVTVQASDSDWVGVEEILMSYGRSKLAGYKVPKKIFKVENLQRTRNGKIKRFMYK